VELEVEDDVELEVDELVLELVELEVDELVLELVELEVEVVVPIFSTNVSAAP
jgi:hypothetical protein